ncbi:YcxB family protein [Chitinophaga ginsengisoli]|uniref:YcxB-like protein n=1 Tax=Chitinophaga ginsengisoli TaxID=363837 RepID=A0A2P8FLN1_9BACT|nr:YcxB family protein [Chitinophaga ginsengisoli]PSL22616.1 YcxB-like protein [Chitinophaga ginsengisoli]
MHFLEFSYNKEEVLNALRYHFLQRGEIKVFRNTLFILLAFTMAGYAFKLVTVGALIGIAAMVLLIIAVFWFLLPVSIYNKAATFKDDIHLKYSEEGITISTRTSEHQRLISWSTFTKVVEAKNFFFLYRGKKNFFLVPTSAFKSEDAQKEFSRLANDNIN